VGDDVSSDAIIRHDPGAAGQFPHARSRSAREEETGGTESAVVSLFDVAGIDAVRTVAVSSSKVAQPTSIVSAGSL